MKDKLILNPLEEYFCICNHCNTKIYKLMRKALSYMELASSLFLDNGWGTPIYGAAIRCPKCGTPPQGVTTKNGDAYYE